MKSCSLYYLIIACILLLLPLNPAAGADDSAGAKPLSGTRIIAVWSVEGSTPEEIREAVGQAKSLGFNAVTWNRPGLAEACHEFGMKAYSMFVPLHRREDARLQELMPGEQGLTGYHPDSIELSDYYQYGGEPAPGNREILDQNLACPNDPGVVEYTRQRVIEARDSGCDGVILDFIGYRNYRGCNCERCRAGLAEFRKNHPVLDGQQAANAYYRKVLVELYDTLYTLTKTVAPGMTVANHIHPVFLPDIFYGLDAKVDLSGITVAWFFEPHWPLDKVRRYTETVVRGPYRYDFTEAMPMVGFYTDWPDRRDRRSAERLARELEIIKASGARHLLMCELGHLLRDTEAGAAVRRALTGP